MLLPHLTYLSTPRLPARAGDGPSPGRAAFEFYPTPPEATRALLSVETFDGAIWEPACGQGHISKVLEAHGYDVVSTDIVDHGYGRSGIEFLDQRLPKAKHILTNPPYGRGLGDAFVKKALAFTAHTGGRVAMLLNIASLCHPARHQRFVRRRPSVIYALDACVCWPNGNPAEATRHTLSHRYAWLVWDCEPSPTTRFEWLSTAPFTDAALRKRKPQTERRSS